ncbi:hypothetical protein Prudu_019217, partial [Prunus dulcis]
VSATHSLSEPQTGRIQRTIVSLIRWQVLVTQSQLELHWKDSGDRLGTPSQSEPQILALTVRASPKLVRQMSSALTKLRVNWMSVDIDITEGKLDEANVKCTDKTEGKLDVRRHRH